MGLFPTPLCRTLGTDRGRQFVKHQEGKETGDFMQESGGQESRHALTESGKQKMGGIYEVRKRSILTRKKKAKNRTISRTKKKKKKGKKATAEKESG